MKEDSHTSKKLISASKFFCLNDIFFLKKAIDTIGPTSYNLIAKDNAHADKTYFQIVH